MDSKKKFNNRLIILFFTITFFHCITSSESFFLPKFMRRQATSPPQKQFQSNNSPLSSRGQHFVGPQQSQHQPAYQLVSNNNINNNNNNNRPPQFNQGESSNQNNNFQVPDALCLACERFPWTPVPGSQSGTGSAVAVGTGNDNNLEQDISRPIEASSEQKPQHYEIQIHKDKGYPIGDEKDRPVTVVINDLGTNVPERNRKPFAIQFDAASSQNNVVQYKPGGYQQSNNNLVPQPVGHSFEQQRRPTLLQPVPSSPNPQPNSQYGSPSNQQQFINDNRPSQNQYGAPLQSKPTLLHPVNPNPNSINPASAPTYFTNVNQYGPPQQQQYKQSYSKIPPINVGAVIAAQQNLKIHDVQPAKLVYQEHTHIYGAPSQHQPSYGPPKQQYGPAPLKQNFPQSYKVPILNQRPSVGSLTINQVPLESVPNYVPLKPQSYYGGPPPSYGIPQPPPPSYQPSGFMKPPGPPPTGPNYAQSQQGYLPPPPPQPPQHGYRQPRPLPPVQPGYGQPPPPPPSVPQSGYNSPRPQPQQNYGNFPPPPPPPSPQQGYNQFSPQPSQPQQGYKPQDKPIPPPIPQRPSPPKTLYGTPHHALPMPEIQMRPPPQSQYYFGAQNDFGRQPSSAGNTFVQKPQIDVQPTGQSQGYQSQNSVDSSSPDIDIRIPTQSSQPGQSQISSNQALQGEYYSLQSITNQVKVLHQEYQPTPSIFPSPPTIPFSRPTNSDSDAKPDSEFVKTHHLQSLNQHVNDESNDNLQTEQQLSHSTEPPSLPATGGGRWEIVPANQYDITHLFNKDKGKSPSVSDYKENQQHTRKRPLPIPVPVPISESDVANSKAPVFVVGHHRPEKYENNVQEQIQQQQNSNDGQSFKPVQLETTIYTTGSAPPISNPNESHQSQSQPQYVAHQSQFDPLPPSVVRALYNSQRTSFLTHQHLIPEQSNDHGNNNRDHTSPVYVNSVTVSEPPPEQGKKSENQVASDFNKDSSSPVRYHTTNNVNPQGQTSDQDQTVVNCNNNPQWVIPGIGRNPNYIRQSSESSSQSQQQQQQQQEQQLSSKPFVYYYPSPMSSVYWVEKPSSILSTSDPNQPQLEYNYGQRVPVTTILQQQYETESDANDAANQAKFSKPSYMTLSTIVSSPTSNNINIDNSNSLVDPIGYENYSYQIEQQQQQQQHQAQENNAGGVAKNAEEGKNTFSSQNVEDDENDEGSSSIIQQISTQAPYDILSFAKDPVFDVQSIEEGIEPEVVYEQSSTTSATTEFPSTPSSYYINEQDQFYTTSSKGNSNEFKPGVSFKSFSSQINSQSQSSEESSNSGNNNYKVKLPKYSTTGDENSFRVVYDTKVSSSNNNNYEIVGPTTLAECFKTTTDPATTLVTATTEVPTSTDIYAAGTSTSGSLDDFTSYDNLISTTFSPYRVNTQNRIRLHSSSRFPSGRPSVTPTLETTPITTDVQNQDVSPASASVHVPIYRPAVTIRGESQFSNGYSTQISSQGGLKSTNALSLEDIYKSTEMKKLGHDLHETLPLSSTSESVSSSHDDEHEVEKHEEEKKKEEDLPPSPPFSRITSTSRKVPAFTPSKRIYSQVEREPIIVESIPVVQSSEQQVHNITSSSSSSNSNRKNNVHDANGETTTPSSTPDMSTKIVKTVRVRQRMRANGNPGLYRARLAAGHGIPSRIKIIQRPASPEYIKNFPEYAVPEGDVLEEDEQKEVKNALIEIKKVK